MFSGSPRERPRHLAGADRAERSPAPAGAQAAHRATPDVGLSELAPLARLKRSRLALALAVTLVALPLLVIDNLPATAETEQPVEVVATADLPVVPSSTRHTAPAPSTTSTSEAPTTTVAPVTTAAPPTTAEAVVVRSAEVPAPAPPPAVAPATTVAPSPIAAVAPVGDPSDVATWDRLAVCEASGNWAMNSGNGYYGGLQFSVASWQNVGGTGYPHQASKAEQIKRGQILQARAGWGQWPSCARRLGYL